MAVSTIVDGRILLVQAKAMGRNGAPGTAAGH